MANSIELQDPFGYEKIEKYLKGLMDKDEEETFFLELEKNPQLKERAIAMARLAKGVHSAGVKNDEDTIDAFRSSDIDSIKDIADIVSNQTINSRREAEMAEKIAEVIEFMKYRESECVSACFAPSASSSKQSNKTERNVGEDQPTPVDTKTIKKSYNRRNLSWIAAAACFVCIFFVGYQYNSYYQTTSLGDEYASSFDVEYDIARGDESKVENELQELKQNISLGQDMENTIHRLEIMWELSLMDTYNDYTDLSPELGWNLAIAHLKNNDRKAALCILNKMSGLYDEDSAMGIQVHELKEKVEKL